MSKKKTHLDEKMTINGERRRLVSTLLASGAVLTTATAVKAEGVDDLRFPGDEPTHKIVYQLNKMDILNFINVFTESSS